MTDPTGGLPPPQGPVPPPPGAVPPPQGGGNWQTPPPPTAAPGGFQTAPVAAEPGPAPGVVYADLMTRIIALVIDGIILFVPYIVVAVILAFIPWGGLIGGLLYVAWSGAYFVYTWTKMRASYGQKFMKLETVSAADGSTLTQDKAIRRWVFMFGPNALVMVLTNLPILGLAILGSLMGLLALGYDIYLLYTASQSPKRQGFHDVQAGTVVVKRVA